MFTWGLMGPGHDLLPGLVDLVEPLGLLGQLLGDVPADEDSLEVDPHVLHEQPPLQDLVGVRQVRHPLLDLVPERGVVPGKDNPITTTSTKC